MLRVAACTTDRCAHTFSRCAKRLHSARAGLSGPQQAAASPVAGSRTSTGLLTAAKGPSARGMAAAAAPAGSEPAGAAADAGGASGGGAAPADPLLQYVVLRRDLWAELDWPLGSVVAQGCHAATAALWGSRESATTQEYCAPENIDHMHKVVLEIKGEPQLRALAAKLAEAGVPHKLWVEQPEDFATCLATAPCRKSTVAPLVKKLKLCRGS